MVCYGKEIKKNYIKKNNIVKARTKVLMKDLMGVNSFVDDPIDKVKWAGAVRE